MPTQRRDGHWLIVEDERTRITVNDKFCKGCVICVEFCPKDVLEMQGTKPRVKDLASCTRCDLCEARCPDFAIWVEKLDT